MTLHHHNNEHNTKRGSVAAADGGISKCASCGKTELFGVKLKFCTACKLVKYCGVECQKNHRPEHKKACKKRAAELKSQCNNNNTTIMIGNNNDGDSEEGMVDHESLARMLESGDISTDRILFTAPQQVTIQPGQDFQSAMNEAKLIADRRMVLQQAHLRFSCLARMSYNSGLDFERHYRDLYEDILNMIYGLINYSMWTMKIRHMQNLPREYWVHCAPSSGSVVIWRSVQRL